MIRKPLADTHEIAGSQRKSRMANAEDNVSGHSRKSRFKSQALLDDAAIIAEMSYVDRNPIRVAMAGIPGESGFISFRSE